ncbi:methyltransferase domain-containing protein [Flavobacterium arcticum]|uniref:tRNA1(Val) (adenine(37)-N6)-methyltransferase n=1 Tax=Flavobacterium arcticum TaxID=1784713 RepID=A0A345HF57_9FLAO|nr:methyltransferase [Flavobacterium arcticum]AXG75217.1 methyltransferase domain-containing protein [Flavobacterium arcticum]KAF2513392.1 methyltransferase [Flavobacterium arcticum]
MFKFKEFSIQQDKCAMKVGTDGVLLGTWTSTNHSPNSILDIGTGTGLIALMLAQRSNAEQIDAIEIDDDTYEQAVDNFENSPWGDRLFCYHAGLDEFVEEMQDEEEYDLIISNPPFYSEDFTTGNEQRDKARFNTSMPFDELAEAAALLLSRDGIFTVILPYKEEENFISIAAQFSLFVFKITRVKGTPETEIKRSLIAFKKQETEIVKIDELIIEIARHQYTPEYIALTKDFYLKM